LRSIDGQSFDNIDLFRLRTGGIDGKSQFALRQMTEHMGLNLMNPGHQERFFEPNIAGERNDLLAYQDAE
jgi:hypothetical protein